MKKLVAIALAAALLSACGGSGTGSGLLQNAGAAAPSTQGATVTFTLVLPATAPAPAANRAPRYVSPATMSAVVALTAQNGTAVPSPQPYAVSIDYANDCTTLAGSVARSTRADRWPLEQAQPGKECTFSIPAPIGVDTFAVSTYDAAQTSANPATLTGNLLSLGTSAPTSVVANAANNVAVTLNGVVAYLQLTVSPSSVDSLPPSLLTLTVSAEDADHNVIRPPGVFATPINLTSNYPGTYTITPASLTVPPAGQATTMYPGAGFCPIPATVFTASSGSVTATATLTVLC